MGGGLRRIARMHGGIVINNQRYVWDYVADEPVPEADMPEGGDRWRESERAKWAEIAANAPQAQS